MFLPRLKFLRKRWTELRDTPVSEAIIRMEQPFRNNSLANSCFSLRDCGSFPWHGYHGYNLHAQLINLPSHAFPYFKFLQSNLSTALYSPVEDTIIKW